MKEKNKFNFIKRFFLNFKKVASDLKKKYKINMDNDDDYVLFVSTAGLTLRGCILIANGITLLASKYMGLPISELLIYPIYEGIITTIKMGVIAEKALVKTVKENKEISTKNEKIIELTKSEEKEEISTKEKARIELLEKVSKANRLIATLPISVQKEYKKELYERLNRYTKIVSEEIKKEKILSLESEYSETIIFSVYLDDLIERINARKNDENYKKKLSKLNKEIELVYSYGLIERINSRKKDEKYKKKLSRLNKEILQEYSDELIDSQTMKR